MEHNREKEIVRYGNCYLDPKYRMGVKRAVRAEEILATLPRGDLLDVGAGRGELGVIAKRLGFRYIGIEPVPYLATSEIYTGVATDLPFANESFEVVCCLDVLEHLVEEDLRPALREMRRVSRGTVFLTASETPSFYGSPDGRDLHISKRPLATWERMFNEEFPLATTKRLGQVGVSPGWLIEYGY